MITRIVLAFVLVTAATACKSKQPAKPTTPPANTQTESAPPAGGAPAPDTADDDQPDTSTKGDPCDGGEVTPKP